jgi:hypothetical protein
MVDNEREEIKKSLNKIGRDNNWHLIIFICVVLLIVVATAVFTKQYLPALINPAGGATTTSNVSGGGVVSDVILLFEVIIVLIAAINVGVFELNKKEIEAQKKELQDDVEKRIQNERNLAKAQNLKAGGVESYGIYVTYTEISKLYLLLRGVVDSEKKKDKALYGAVKLAIKKNNEESRGYLDDAIKMTELAIKSFKKLDLDFQKINDVVICICNNNLAFYLVLRGGKGDIARAEILAESIKENIRKYPDHASAWMDTLEIVDQTRKS